MSDEERMCICVTTIRIDLTCLLPTEILNFFYCRDKARTSSRSLGDLEEQLFYISAPVSIPDLPYNFQPLQSLP